MPTYLKYKYIFFIFRFKVGSWFFFQLSRIRIHEKKCRILIPVPRYRMMYFTKCKARQKAMVNGNGKSARTERNLCLPRGILLLPFEEEWGMEPIRTESKNACTDPRPCGSVFSPPKQSTQCRDPKYFHIKYTPLVLPNYTLQLDFLTWEPDARKCWWQSWSPP